MSSIAPFSNLEKVFKEFEKPSKYGELLKNGVQNLKNIVCHIKYSIGFYRSYTNNYNRFLKNCVETNRRIKFQKYLDEDPLNVVPFHCPTVKDPREVSDYINKELSDDN